MCIQTLKKEGNTNENKRSKYSDGVAAKESLLSSVNRLVMLGLIPNCPESHHNVKVILEELGLESLEFLKSIDIKLVMILMGKSSGKPKFGCPFCSAAQPFKEKGQLYTLSRLVELHQAFVADGRPYKDQMKYENVTNLPILTSNDLDMKVLDMVVPPELHLLIGAVDKMMKEMENNIFYVPDNKTPSVATDDSNNKEKETEDNEILIVQKGKIDKKIAAAKVKAAKAKAAKAKAAKVKAAKAKAANEKKAAKKAEMVKKKAAKLAGRKFMDDYLKKSEVALVRKSYQGAHSLEGNQSRSFLKKIPILEDHLKTQSTQVVKNGLPYLAAFRAFDKVVSGCFGLDLDPEYTNYITNFEEAYSALGISITPKVHIITQHIEEFLTKENSNREKKVGLGHFSEQSFESGHHDVKVLWERVKLAEGHPDYPIRLKHFCSRYFGNHI